MRLRRSPLSRTGLVASVALVAVAGAAGCGSTDTSSLFGRSGPGDVLSSGGTFVTGGGGTYVSPFGSGGVSGSGGSGGSAAFAGAGGLSVISPGAGGLGGASGASAGGASAGAGGAVDAGDPLQNLPEPLRTLAKCSFTGTWATFVSVPVTWPQAPFVLYSGVGEVRQWTLSHRVQDSLLNIHETVSACAITLPDLSGAILSGNQKFGIRFPDAVFDNGVAPPYSFKTTASVVGTHVEWATEPVATLTGLSLPGPATDAWPSPANPSGFRDDDKDSYPAITVLPVDPSVDPSYNWPPVALPQILGADFKRASLIFIVSRSVAKLHGTVASCDELDGAAEIVTIAGTPSINSTVVGCVRTDGVMCVQSEADFLNQNRPQFVPSGPGTLVSVRLPDGATCADARARFPK